MAWFLYGDQQKRKLRKGIWLRTRSLPAELAKTIDSKMLLSESLAWIIVNELKPNNQVLLEVWCHQRSYRSRLRGRYTVFYITADEDNNWVCESDLGRGLVK